MLVLPHVDNVVGVRHPVAAIAAAARRLGVRYVAVDGAQAVGMVPVELRSLGVDFYATSAHKWLQAPKGLGLFYVRRAVREELRPMWVTWGQSSWRGSARVFEDYGTRDPSDLLVLADAIGFQEALGAERKEVHYRALRELARERAEASPRLGWRSPDAWELGASLYAVELNGAASAVVSEELFERHGIVLRPFQTPELNTLRISPNALNTAAELEGLFEHLERLI